MLMYEISVETYSKGTAYRIRHVVDKKTICLVYKDEMTARVVLEALNMQSDLLRCGLYDKVIERLDKIRLYNEQLNQGG